jgi:hypothetical protein
MSKLVTGSGTVVGPVAVKVAGYVLVRDPALLKFDITVAYGWLNWSVKTICNGLASAKPDPASEACRANPCMVIVADELPPAPFRKVKAEPGGVQVNDEQVGSPTPANTVCM